MAVRGVLLRIFSAAASSAVLRAPGRGAEARGRDRPASACHRHAPQTGAAQADRPVKTVAKRGARNRTRRRLEPAGHRGRQRRDAWRVIRRRGCPAAHRRQRRAHQRRGSECRSLPRGVGEALEAVPGPDRHPAFRRGQSQPVFSARLQPRPRHGSRHQRRRHARQHADPWPWAGLCRYQFSDPRTDPVGECPQGSVLRRRRRLQLRRRPSRSTTSTSCRKTSRSSPLAASAIGAGSPPVRPRSARARCSPPSKASNTTARGTCRTMSARSTACCATARAPRPTV